MIFGTKGKKRNSRSIQMIIIRYFSIVMMVGMGFLALILYNVFDNRVSRSSIVASEQLIQQAKDNLEDYLYNMQGIRDTLSNEIDLDTNISKTELKEKMELLYMANMDNLVSIACFTEDGELVASVPYNMVKKDMSVTEADWFVNTLESPLESCISTPHVQNLFEINGYRYFWAVSLSNVVKMKVGDEVKRCVLVVDMKYSSIGKIFRELNSDSSNTYTYLSSKNGTIIYHPNANLISSGLFHENEKETVKHSDGTWTERFDGQNRLITMKTMDYTNWRIVKVTTQSSISMSMNDTKYIVVITLILSIIILVFITALVSKHITSPLEELSDSIEVLNDDGLPREIYVGGSNEVEYVGRTLRDFVERLRKLMDDIVKEQEEKRKSELDALQAQINPHFLYNTLDSIVWMIEGERYEDAIFMIRQLASLFRISLSKGKTMITIEDELKHAENYMNIQKIRYHNQFEIDYEIDPEILPCVIVKLVLQPLLENALYYAVDALGGEGDILVRGFREGDNVYLQVIDNGPGMSEEVVEHLLEEDNHAPKHGSGVGLMNIHKRLQIRFGETYGLKIESELDEGTTVTLHLPYQLYEKGE